MVTNDFNILTFTKTGYQESKTLVVEFLGKREHFAGVDDVVMDFL